jgi:hypothetical protein
LQAKVHTGKQQIASRTFHGQAYERGIERGSGH